MKRRDFLKLASTSAIGLPLTVQGMNIDVLANSAFLQNLAVDTNKVLVLITLSGGNDGLNMIIPKDQYSNLSIHRSNILIPESQILDLTTETGLHPAMSALQNMYVNEGEVSIVQGVGYLNPNRSHFRSTDILHTASDSETVLRTGYLGRYLDSAVNSHHNDFPSPLYPDPFAIAIGNSVSQTCEGIVSNYSLAINDPFNINPLLTSAGGTPPPGYYADRLNYLQTTIQQTNEYSEVIENAANSGNNLTTYPETALAQKLKIIANLISGGLGTRIYVVSQGGYDTHNAQISGETTSGLHAELLGTLSDAIGSFQQDLKLLGVDDRVLGMAYSEFGRRIESNGGNGTDHGDAGPMVLFGSKVSSGIIGTNPIIPSVVTSAQSVQMQFDFRDVYRNILEGWFCNDPVTVREEILLGTYNNPGVIDDPCLSLFSHHTSNSERSAEQAIKVYPNPVKSYLYIEAIQDFKQAHIFVLSPTREPIYDNENWNGQKLTIDMGRFINGIYIVQVVVGKQVSTKNVIKIS